MGFPEQSFERAKVLDGKRRQNATRDTRAMGPTPEEDDEESLASFGNRSLGARYNVQFYKTKLCAFWMNGRCTRRFCKYAHGEAEIQKPPNLAKTAMCRKMASAGKCGDANCSFAHDINELRATKSFFKTTMCSFERLGVCKLGDQCRHAHSKAELRPNFDAQLRQLSELAARGAEDSDDDDMFEEDNIEFDRAATIPADFPYAHQRNDLPPYVFRGRPDQAEGSDDEFSDRVMDMPAIPFARGMTVPAPYQRTAAGAGGRNFVRQASAPDGAGLAESLNTQCHAVPGTPAAADWTGCMVNLGRQSSAPIRLQGVPEQHGAQRAGMQMDQSFDYQSFVRQRSAPMSDCTWLGQPSMQMALQQQSVHMHNGSMSFDRQMSAPVSQMRDGSVTPFARQSSLPVSDLQWSECDASSAMFSRQSTALPESVHSLLSRQTTMTTMMEGNGQDKATPVIPVALIPVDPSAAHMGTGSTCVQMNMIPMSQAVMGPIVMPGMVPIRSAVGDQQAKLHQMSGRQPSQQLSAQQLASQQMQALQQLQQQHEHLLCQQQLQLPQTQQGQQLRFCASVFTPGALSQDSGIPQSTCYTQDSVQCAEDLIRRMQTSMLEAALPEVYED